MPWRERPGVLTPDERTLVRRWLELADHSAPAFRNAETEFSVSGELALDNAVARLMLGVIQERLPDWASVNVATGEYTSARPRFRRRSSAVSLLPAKLFEINWADSGPGFSWPEAYHVTHVPDLNVRVFTASVDTDEVWGVADLAVGWARPRRDISWGTNAVIGSWWRHLKTLGNLAWCDFLEPGIITEEQAESLRRQVFGADRLDDW